MFSLVSKDTDSFFLYIYITFLINLKINMHLINLFSWIQMNFFFFNTYNYFILEDTENICKM